MTRDELRAECIEAIWRRACELGIFISYGQAAILFDSLNGVARVNPIEATEEMLIAARDWSFAKNGRPVGNDQARGCLNSMSAIGDLTNPPEEKP